MTMEWTPSSWGRKFTGSGTWTLRLSADSIELSVGSQRHRALIEGESPLRIRHGIFWTDVTLRPGQADEVVVDGIPNRHGADISAAVEAIVIRQRREALLRAEVDRQTERRERLQHALSSILGWRASVSLVVADANSKRRWITQEQVQGFIADKPDLLISETELLELLNDDDVRLSLKDRLQDAENAVTLWQADLPRAVANRNEKYTISELSDYEDLFDRVESRPLTEEQARAVVCFDNRVQVVASAGSGKTSTMVAKAAYAIHRQIVAPEKIVMLAFNTAAASELGERSAKSFKALGMGAVSVDAKTFHALGIEIIGRATGKKPSVPPWASEKAAGLRKLGEIIDQIKDRSPAFRTKWDMFRLVFGHDTFGFGNPVPGDDWDNSKRRAGMRTLRGETVKSAEECAIANWLFYNGVTYVYEQRYEFETVTSEHSQYHPDFYYPDLNLYHEHFALDEAGNPPKSFGDYLDGVAWKRAEHARRGTECIETTSHQLWSGQLFKHLAKELKERGIQLDPNPERPLPENGRAPLEHADLVEVIRCFISHAKSNNLSHYDLAQRLQKMPAGSFYFRHHLFLQIAAPVRDAWDTALAEAGGIDFEDMLNQAAEHLESGRYESPYELVLADEFQDASWARARLCLALVKAPGRYLFAVGDDWQSINRFAGSDVSVMTGFEDWCGQGKVLRLEQTFRCPQELCDVSSHFVTKNPAQIRKNVRSTTKALGPVLQAFQVQGKNELQDAIRKHLAKLHESLESGSAPLGRNGKVSVFVLGRYNADEQFVPDDWRSSFGNLLEVKFTSIHSSKGAEADYVILPSMVRRGFPNLRREDPVLALAMPGSDSFYLSEERRLFYVALTRARRSVAMFTVQGQTSVFLEELMADGFVRLTDTDGKRIHEQKCPVCKQGVMAERRSKHGPFMACTNYPGCRHKWDGSRRVPRARPRY
jgi:DNA helicase-4